MDRQKITGWILIVWATGYILYFLKTRLMIDGPPIEKKEWVYFWLAVGGAFLGTINVRMAARRRRVQQ